VLRNSTTQRDVTERSEPDGFEAQITSWGTSGDGDPDAHSRKSSGQMTALLEVVRTIVALVVAGDWPALDRTISGSTLSGADVRLAVAQYGRALVVPPSESFDALDAVEVENMGRRTVQIRVPLWTREEGRSDLEMNITATEVGPGLWSAGIDDLLVP
jgi:hypothetical protein